VNERVTAHLSTHFGVIARPELLALGVSQRQIEWMLTCGELVHVHRGVYRHAAAPRSYDQRVHAGLVATGPDAVASHRSALVLHGARNFSADLVELSTTARSRSRRTGMIVHRTSLLERRHVCIRRGLRVTTPARTLVDAATVMAPQLVARFAQDWLANRVTRVDELNTVLDELPTRNGAASFRRALEAVDLRGADSVPEARLGVVLNAAGIPPTLHHLVTVETGDTFELDWAYPSARVGLEVDGYGIHLRSFDAFEKDRFRRNEIEVVGWHVLNFTRRMVRNRPSQVVDQVRRALTMARSPQ
jgi:very-short-patch-repair endonuclease